jgi:hypothetical protein
MSYSGGGGGGGGGRGMSPRAPRPDIGASAAKRQAIREYIKERRGSHTDGATSGEARRA